MGPFLYGALLLLSDILKRHQSGNTAVDEVEHFITEEKEY